MVPRDSVVAREKEEEDCWEKNVGMNEEGTSEATVDAKEAATQPTAQPTPPVTPPVTPSVTPSVTTMPPEAYCLRPRETVIGVARRVRSRQRFDE